MEVPVRETRGAGKLQAKLGVTQCCAERFAPDSGRLAAFWWDLYLASIKTCCADLRYWTQMRPWRSRTAVWCHFLLLPRRGIWMPAIKPCSHKISIRNTFYPEERERKKSGGGGIGVYFLEFSLTLSVRRMLYGWAVGGRGGGRGELRLRRSQNQHKEQTAALIPLPTSLKSTSQSMILCIYT